MSPHTRIAPIGFPQLPSHLSSCSEAMVLWDRSRLSTTNTTIDGWCGPYSEYVSNLITKLRFFFVCYCAVFNWLVYGKICSKPRISWWTMGGGSAIFPWNQSMDDVCIFCVPLHHKTTEWSCFAQSQTCGRMGLFSSPKVVDGHADQHSKASNVLGQCRCWFLYATIWRSSNEAPDVLPRTSLGR